MSDPSPPAGSSSGTPADAPCVLTTRAWVDGKVGPADFSLDDVSEWIGRDDTVVWVDVAEPTLEVLRHLANELDLHELAVEDALSPHQRPKLDRYGSHLFLACHAVGVDTATAELSVTEIDAFVGPRWLVTVRKGSGFDMGIVGERWARSEDLLRIGVGFLLYGLLDVVVDGYFDTVQCFDDYYDDVSEQLFSDEPLDRERQRTWFLMRRALVQLHRLVVPLREAISALMRREHSAVPEPLYPYYQDVYDHVLRVSEATDSLRDLVSTIVETNLSLRDYRQNQVMKQVTSWAAIVAVPTLITGYYGMNVPYPGIGKHWAVWFSITLMLGLSGTLWVVFRRKDWI